MLHRGFCFYETKLRKGKIVKNPISNLIQCFQFWRKMKQYPKLFSASDACMQLSRVLLPGRLNDNEAASGLKRSLVILDHHSKSETISKVHCKPLNIDFLWNGVVDNNLFFMAEQEFCIKNPHCYTTHPILLHNTRQIIDIGACEGLFAFRMGRDLANVHTHCFEPNNQMAQLLEKGAELNQVSDSISVHCKALLDKSGFVKFAESNSPDAGIVVPTNAHDPEAVQCISLDAFCDENEIKLTKDDLIKIDAEGSDFDVLKGAEQILKTSRPQIAVTTYHKDEHAESIYQWLRDLDLGYHFRLKGFSFWTSKPRPVLLQASTLKKQ